MSDGEAVGLAWFALAWIAWTIALAFAVRAMGRSAVGWGAVALLLSPLAAWGLLLLLGRGGQPCRYCRAPLREAAHVCAECGREQNTAETSAVQPTAKADPPRPSTLDQLAHRERVSALDQLERSSRGRP